MMLFGLLGIFSGLLKRGGLNENNKGLWVPKLSYLLIYDV
jgi:hypothetical protein